MPRRCHDAHQAPTAVALAVALALGVACGTAARTVQSNLAPAGSKRDDGSGLLATASRRIDARSGYAGTGYAGALSYGAGTYGGGRFGGGIYANYQFTTSLPQDRDVGSYDASYVVDETLKTGRVVGNVRWSRRPTSDRIGPDGCPKPAAATPAPTNAVVFIRNIRRGRGFPSLDGYPTRRWQVGGTLAVSRCELQPYVQVVGPLGAILVARLDHDGPDGIRQRKTSAPLELGLLEKGMALDFHSRGDERIGQLRSRGPAVLANQRGALAWVMAASHPYYVATREDGSFALLDVPAGSYELVAWHPPVRLASGKLSPPLQAVRKVTVRTGKKTRTNLKLRAP